MEKISYGKSNGLNLHLLIALSRTTKKVHGRSATVFGAGGLTTAQFGVLDVLYHKGARSIRQITQLVLSTGGNMTVVIRNMEKHGWITRCVDPGDRRSTVVSITEEGKRLFERIFPEHLKDLDNCFESLTEEEKDTLIALLKKAGGHDPG